MPNQVICTFWGALASGSGAGAGAGSSLPPQPCNAATAAAARVNAHLFDLITVSPESLRVTATAQETEVTDPTLSNRFQSGQGQTLVAYPFRSSSRRLKDSAAGRSERPRRRMIPILRLKACSSGMDA